MGFPKKQQQKEGGVLEQEGKKWVIAGVPLRSPLKPIFTNQTKKPFQKKEREDEEEEEEYDSTTPTSQETRISSALTCPPAPRKRKPSSKCYFINNGREFFSPPDLETVFIRRVVERA